MHKGTTNMFEQGIFESAASKKHQLELACQVVKMILKIDDVIAPQEYEWSGKKSGWLKNNLLLVIIIYFILKSKMSID